MINTLSLKIGLSISMHNENMETIRAIKSFQKFHPNSEISLWGNERANLLEVGEHLGLDTKDSPQYVNKLMNLLHSPTPYNSKEGAKILREFLFCALDVYKSMNCEYVLYLHPDHLVINKFHQKILKNDLEIHKVNRYSPIQREAWKNTTGKKLKLKSYGLAGYFRRDSLISSLEFLLNENRINLDELLSQDINFIFEDLNKFLSYMYDIGVYCL